MIGRLLRKSDYERLLAVPPCSRSAHFALHYLCAPPGVPAGAARSELFTGDSPECAAVVDNSHGSCWLGTVLPKRHAPRAVTRNLLRRQVRAAMLRHRAALRPGLWLVRLRQPFPRSRFASADSPSLRREASEELDRLLGRALA